MKNRTHLDAIARAGRGYVYNDTWYCLHRPQCRALKVMKPEPADPWYDFVHGAPYPSGRNRGVTAFFDAPLEEVEAWLNKWRREWWTCERPECFGSSPRRPPARDTAGESSP